MQFVMPTLGWRYLLALSSIPSSLLLLFYWVAPESPRFLCSKGRTTEALSILEKIARLNGTKLPPGRLVSEHLIELHEKNPESEDTHLLSPTRGNEDATSKATNPNTGVLSSLLVLLSPKLLRSTLLLWFVFFGNAFSYYGLVLLTSELSNGQSKCIPKLLREEKSQDVSYRDIFITGFAGNHLMLFFFSPFSIPWSVNYVNENVYTTAKKLVSKIYFLFHAELPGLLIAAFTVDRLGRKSSMSSMFFICCICLLPLLVHQPQNLTTGFLFGARTCITATFTIVYIYAPEVNFEFYIIFRVNDIKMLLHSLTKMKIWKTW